MAKLCHCWPPVSTYGSWMVASEHRRDSLTCIDLGEENVAFLLSGPLFSFALVGQKVSAPTSLRWQVNKHENHRPWLMASNEPTKRLMAWRLMFLQWACCPAEDGIWFRTVLLHCTFALHCTLLMTWFHCILGAAKNWSFFKEFRAVPGCPCQFEGVVLL